jgi:2-phospho-L-lactate guanylyltransferase
MSVWVAIPVKPLRLAKSRLAEALTPDERYAFAEAMLRHVLSVVQSAPQVTGTVVISRDNLALSLAREYGAKTIQESGTPELNAALMRATTVIASWRSDAVLVLPADLPLIAQEDVNQIIEKGQQPNTIVIATDYHQNGTNALFIRPPGLIDYAYGEGSYRRHIDMAQTVGADVKHYESERLLQDIDLPEDIENYRRMVQSGNYKDTITLDAIHTLQKEVD